MSPVLTGIQVDFDGFQAYDVEPVSIPDVLADRPILVFGKWRGNPEGSIRLRGVTGDGKYSETVKISDFKPSRDNAALKYLWARHRIGILSDYNNLRNDERRIEEITELGLNYHLLTAYTSFVAVDGDVRNRDGKPVAVNQPLPLPEGVSDYAVGGSGNYAAVPAMQKMWGMRGNVEARLSEEKQAAQDISTPRKKDKEKKVGVTRVIAGIGLSKDDILKVAENQLSEIEKCFSGIKISGTIKLNLTIRPDGTVQSADMIARAIKDGKLRRCIIDQIQRWQFPAAANGQTVKAEIVITVSL
jgi:Ca-activated chloride channel family protein